MKASEILKSECCGHCYNTLGGKEDVIAMVEKLERDNETYLKALIEIEDTPSSSNDVLILAGFAISDTNEKL